MRRETGRFKIFTRQWWRMEGGQKVPNSGGRKHVISYADTADEARSICRVWNANHDPGPLSRKAEFTEI